MNLIRIFTFLTIFGLLFFSTTGKTSIDYIELNSKSSYLREIVYGQEDKVENDAEIDDDDENTGRTDDTVTTTTNDIFVREE